MSLRDWVAALQIPLFTAVLAPGVVGVSLVVRLGAELPPLALFLVFLALVLVQAAANLHKGLVESADRKGPPAEVPSLYVFDSGAVERLGWSPRRLRLLLADLYLVGAIAGLALVLRYGDLVLLGIGLAGGLLAFFYSGPPLKLSYRGVGEVATFLAFGPILVAGVAYVFLQAVPPEALWSGALMGFLASLISFERYFPLAEEDASKGKRTPVVRLGPERATRVLWLLLGAPYATAAVGGLLGQHALLAFGATLPLAVGLGLSHRRGLEEPRAFGRATLLAVALHGVGGAAVALAYLLL